MKRNMKGKKANQCKMGDCDLSIRHEVTIGSPIGMATYPCCCKHYDFVFTTVIKTKYEGDDDRIASEIATKRFLHSIACNYITDRGRCDFCSPARSAVFEYPCRTFTLPPEFGFNAIESQGDWAACFRCAALVENHAFDKLVALAPEAERDRSRQILDKFNANRLGPRKVFVNDGD